MGAELPRIPFARGERAVVRLEEEAINEPTSFRNSGDCAAGILSRDVRGRSSGDFADESVRAADCHGGEGRAHAGNRRLAA